jgi:hypothetical protein
MRAEFDTILRDFMDQLRIATEDGWYRTQPDHYRAILASIDSVLREYRDHTTSQAGVIVDPVLGPARHAAYPGPFSFRRSLRPLFSLIPVSRGRV